MGTTPNTSAAALLNGKDDAQWYQMLCTQRISSIVGSQGSYKLSVENAGSFNLTISTQNAYPAFEMTQTGNDTLYVLQIMGKQEANLIKRLSDNVVSLQTVNLGSYTQTINRKRVDVSHYLFTLGLQLYYNNWLSFDAAGTYSLPSTSADDVVTCCSSTMQGARDCAYASAAEHCPSGGGICVDQGESSNTTGAGSSCVVLVFSCGGC